MGFISPSLPDFDLDEWARLPHHGKLKPLAQDWAVNGFGTPSAIYLLYAVKLVGFVAGAALVMGLFGDVTWTDPIAYQKAVVWTLLWEILGLGCGSMPLTFRFVPPIGGLLYFLRPGTIRLPPWPQLPLTAGTTRGPVDVLLYAAVLGDGGYLLSQDVLRHLPLSILLVCLGLLGLRDKAAFLAARPEHYAVMLIVFLFAPVNWVFALKLVMVALWWGAATSKLNRHFPFVVAVMISNTPWQRSTWVKKRLWRSYPDDLRPSKLAELAAHGGTVVEYLVPLVLLLSHGGLVTAAAVTVMVAFHVHITSTLPLGVPLEWNLFFIYSTLFLFGHYAAVHTFDAPLLGVILVITLVAIPVLGNFRPDLVSFLPGMRYYAGNWATSAWLFRNDGAEELLDERLTKAAPIVVKQLEGLYDRQLAELLLYKGLAFRAMHSHGRALGGLMCRAVDDLSDYTVREGELVAGVALGWNFGEGHLHHAQLLRAIQERCDFAPGQLRVITLEAQPMRKDTQAYEILDAATGLLERGQVKVSDMCARQPWLDEDDVTIPVVLA